MTFGLGYSEIALILIVALIVIGPRKLPQLLRDVGRIMGQIRRTSDELRREILFSDDIRDIKSSVRDMVDPTTPPPVPPRMKVKPKAEASSEEGASEDWKQDPAYLDETTPKEGPEGKPDNDG